MGRKPRTTLPTLQDTLRPNWPKKDAIKQTDAAAKQKQVYYYNCRNGVRIPPPLSPRYTVLTKLYGQKQWSTPAVVHSACPTLRSYVVETGQGDGYRRNRRHLLATPNAHSPVGEEYMNNELPLATESSATPTQRTGTVTRWICKLMDCGKWGMRKMAV